MDCRLPCHRGEVSVHLVKMGKDGGLRNLAAFNSSGQQSCWRTQACAASRLALTCDAARLQLENLKMQPTFLDRNVNEGFSGG